MDTSRLHWLDGFDLAALPSNHALERTRETEERDQSKEAFCAIASDRSATAGRSTPSLGTVATGAEEATMPSTGLKRLQDDWPLLTYYQKFESIVALIMTLITGLIIVAALFRLTFAVVSGLLLGALDPLNHEVFQTVFGEIMTLLIALEFNHTLQYVVTRQQSIIQTSVVLLIALLALARKFIILDLHTVTEGQLFGLAAATLALGATYWLLRERHANKGASGA